jgi:hypothetical protein
MASGPHYQIGNYIGEIVAQGLSKARTGNSQFVVRVKVLGVTGQNGAFLTDPFQYERTIFMTITPNTIDRIADTLEMLGYNRQGFGPLDPSHPQHVSFIGKQVDLYCNHENDQNGNLREKWGISTGSGGKALDLTPLNQKELRELDALFGRNIRSAPSTSVASPVTGRAPQNRATTAEEITDDDIPF